MKLLWIVVPTFERFDCINNLITQLEDQDFQNYKLIVVDHGVEKVNISDSENIKYLSADNKLWWSGAINEGLRFVLSEIKDEIAPILVINDDVEFSNKDYLSNLYYYWVENKNTLIGSICTTSAGQIIYCNMLYDFRSAKLDYKHKGQNIRDLDQDVYPSHVLKGRGTMIPSDVFTEIGLYNEKFLPHYKADHELIYRAYKKGYKVKVLKNAVLYSILDSPNSIDKHNIFKSLWSVLWGKRSVANLKDLFNYSFLCFNPIYAVYYFSLNASKIVIMYSIKAIK